MAAQQRDCGMGAVQNAALLNRRGSGRPQPPRQEVKLRNGHMPHALRLQAVCAAISCVDESPTAAASPGVSLLR